MVENASRSQDEKLERKRLKKLKRQQAARAEASQPPETAAPALNANGSPASCSADADREAQPQKKKKRKQQPDSTSLDAHAEPEAHKSKKKKKKQLQEATASIPDSVQHEPNGLQTAKHTLSASTPADQTAAASTEGLQPKKKKSKPTGAPPVAMWAAVGNREAAKSGKPVQKALYAEDPAVTRMTDASVQQWRDERQTAVTGCNIKPVTAFSQAGEPVLPFRRST